MLICLCVCVCACVCVCINCFTFKECSLDADLLLYPETSPFPLSPPPHPGNHWAPLILDTSYEDTRTDVRGANLRSTVVLQAVSDKGLGEASVEKRVVMGQGCGGGWAFRRWNQGDNILVPPFLEGDCALPLQVTALFPQVMYSLHERQGVFLGEDAYHGDYCLQLLKT